MNINPSFDLFAKSATGIRAENQDNYLLVYPDGKCAYLMDEQVQHNEIDHWPIGNVRMVVADGMGGHDFGRQAAEAVINKLLKLPFQSKPDDLKTALLSIHTELHQQFYQGVKTPGSTLVMVDITADGQAVIANIGDSRIYLYSSQGWLQLSRDHTLMEFAYRDGDIDTKTYHQNLLQCSGQIAQAMAFGSSGIIADEKGLKRQKHIENLRIDMELDIKSLHLPVGNMLLLASDGIWDNQPRYSPAQLDIEYPENIIHCAFEQAQQANSRDNMTALLLLNNMNT